MEEAPTDVNKGNIYSVIDGGIANASFVGLAGNNIPQWTLIIYNEPNWFLLMLILVMSFGTMG